MTMMSVPWTPAGPTDEEVARAQSLFTPATPPTPDPMMSMGPPPPAPYVDDGSMMSLAVPASMPEPVAMNYASTPAPQLPPEVIERAKTAVAPPTAHAAARPAATTAAPAPSLQTNVDKARAGVDKTYDEQRAAERAGGAADQAANTAKADFHENEALRQAWESSERHREYTDIQNRHDAYLAKSEGMLADLQDQKVDSARLFKNNPLFTIGALVLGATGNGIGTALQFIDRDLRDQQSAIDNKATSLRARDSLYGQMRASFGDKRLADENFRVMGLEAAKQQLSAIGARSSNPQVQATVDKQVAALNQEQAKRKEALAVEARRVAQQQAAAAKAQMLAQQQRQWEHYKTMRELDQKDKELDQKKGDRTDKQVGDLSKALEDSKVPQRETLVNRLDAQRPRVNGQYNTNEAIPGLDWKSNLATKLPFGEYILSPQERINRSDWDKLKTQYRNEVTGSGGSDAEAEKLDKAFSGASTAAEQHAAIENAKQVLASLRSNAEAGVDPAARDIYNQRRGRATTPPPPSSLRPGLK